MELTATFKELSSYIQARFGQPVTLSAAEFSGPRHDCRRGIALLLLPITGTGDGVHPLEGHRIRICLAEIEKAKSLVENVALHTISAASDSLMIEFGLNE